MFLSTEKSRLLKPGPMTTFRPRFPKRATGINAVVSNQVSTLQQYYRTDDIRPQCVCYCVNRGVRSDNVNRIAALQLNNRRQLPPFFNSIALEGQLINPADDETVAASVIRKPAIISQVVTVLHGDYRRGHLVSCSRLFGPRIGGVEL